jgi:quinol monooxygenase YgiN
MASRGLLVRLDVKHGRDADAENFLRSALPLVRAEPATQAWFALRFGRGECGIFDVFADDAGRDSHLNGAVAQALMKEADELLEKPPEIGKLDILAEKLPLADAAETVTKGVLLTFKAKVGHEGEVEQFLRDARALVMQEPKTYAWFAIRLPDGHYGIFDVFPDNGGRFAHVTGHVPRELARHSLALLGSVPEMTLLDVLSAKL